MAAVKEKLERGIAVLAAVCEGNPGATAERLEEPSALLTPLLASPLVGEAAAFQALLGLARCLPSGLAASSLAIATALRLVVMSQAYGAS